MDTCAITPRGPFSLPEAAMFGFGHRHETTFDGVMRLAFCREDTWQPVGVALHQTPDLVVHGKGTCDATVTAQVARMLSLDVDGRAFSAVGERDPVIRRLQAAAPGLRPPLFASAYEAAAWCVLSARRPARQMQAVRERLAAEHGAILAVGGQALACFPTPAALLRVESFPGLDTTKIERLHAVAGSALDGRLDTETLRSLDPAEAAARVQELPGIGPFSADLIVVRTLGHTDVLPGNEPRGLALVGELYGLGRPATVAELTDIASAWRPFRTWALVLVRAAAGRLAAA